MITSTLAILAVVFAWLTAEWKGGMLWPLTGLISIGCLFAVIWRSL